MSDATLYCWVTKDRATKHRLLNYSIPSTRPVDPAGQARLYDEAVRAALAAFAGTLEVPREFPNLPVRYLVQVPVDESLFAADVDEDRLAETLALLAARHVVEDACFFAGVPCELG